MGSEEAEVERMVWLCGVDGVKDRWRAVLRNSATKQFRWSDASFEEILSFPEAPLIIAIDIPIGLPDVIKSERSEM
jgi:predicted RNase H-like nuclease